MLRKFSVRNFRCLRKLDIEPLARVNLIVGENNIGKTALARGAISTFQTGHPGSPIASKSFPGRSRGGHLADIWEELEWLFHGKQTTADH